MLRSITGGWGSYPLCMSPCRSDCLISVSGVRRTVSEDSPNLDGSESFLLIARTCRFVTSSSEVAQDPTGIPANSQILVS